ncbi:hypothetical protein CWS51_16670 [Klebsiella michiganensis]|nr:hypothetical protein [Klebsiella michiganensis]
MKRRTSSVLFRQRRTDPEYYSKGLGIAPRINPALEKVTASPEYSAIKARWIKASLIVAYRKDTPLKGIAPQTFLYAIRDHRLIRQRTNGSLVSLIFKSFQYIMRVDNIILSTRTFKM